MGNPRLTEKNHRRQSRNRPGGETAKEGGPDQKRPEEIPRRQGDGRRKRLWPAAARKKPRQGGMAEAAGREYNKTAASFTSFFV